MPGETEWRESEGDVGAATDEALDLGSSWPASSWLARVILGRLSVPRPGRVALVALALVGTMTVGPLERVSPTVGGPWNCTIGQQPAADFAPAARDLPGSLLAEQEQRPRRGC